MRSTDETLSAGSRWNKDTEFIRGEKQSMISQRLQPLSGVHKSTTSGELQRNRGKHGYGYKQAHTKAIEQRKGKVNPRIDGGTWVFIETLIRKDWSSEHIHSWMKENMGVTVSHEWIYQYILQDKQTGGDLYTHLRCRKKRKK